MLDIRDALRRELSQLPTPPLNGVFVSTSSSLAASPTKSSEPNPSFNGTYPCVQWLIGQSRQKSGRLDVITSYINPYSLAVSKDTRIRRALFLLTYISVHEFLRIRMLVQFESIVILTRSNAYSRMISEGLRDGFSLRLRNPTKHGKVTPLEDGIKKWVGKRRVPHP